MAEENKKDINAIFNSEKTLAKVLNKKLIEAQTNNISSRDFMESEKENFDLLKYNFDLLIEFSKALFTKSEPFYGSLFIDMDKEFDFEQRGLIDLVPTNNGGRNSFSLKFNPLFLCYGDEKNQGYSFREFNCFVKAELQRFVWDLFIKEQSDLFMGKENSRILFEKAAETFLSEGLRLLEEHEIREDERRPCKIPFDYFTATKLNAETNKTPQRETDFLYYKKFIEAFSQKNPPSPGNDGSNNSPSNISKDTTSSKRMSSGSNSGTNNNMASPLNMNGKGTHDWRSFKATREIEENKKSLIHGVISRLEEKHRGTIPALLQEKIDQILKPPEIDWRAYFRKLVGTVPVPFRKTRKRLSRRQPKRFDIPGRLPDMKVNVVCCIDTSGSVSDEQISYILNEIFGIVKYAKAEITVVEFDACVEKVYEIKKKTDIQTEVKGRGGTIFTAALDFVNGVESEYTKGFTKHPKFGKFKDAVMVFFTDGYGEDRIDKPRTYKNLWVVLDGPKNLSVENPYGEVKSLMRDEKYRNKFGV